MKKGECWTGRHQEVNYSKVRGVSTYVRYKRCNCERSIEHLTWNSPLSCISKLSHSTGRGIGKHENRKDIYKMGNFYLLKGAYRHWINDIILVIPHIGSVDRLVKRFALKKGKNHKQNEERNVTNSKLPGILSAYICGDRKQSCSFKIHNYLMRQTSPTANYTCRFSIRYVKIMFWSIFTCTMSIAHDLILKYKVTLPPCTLSIFTPVFTASVLVFFGFPCTFMNSFFVSKHLTQVSTKISNNAFPCCQNFSLSRNISPPIIPIPRIIFAFFIAHRFIISL